MSKGGACSRKRRGTLGLRRFARQAGIDLANLNRVWKGRHEPSQVMLVKLRALLAEEP